MTTTGFFRLSSTIIVLLWILDVMKVSVTSSLAFGGIQALIPALPWLCFGPDIIGFILSGTAAVQISGPG